MAYFSQAHICQCLTGLSTSRRNFVVSVFADRVLTGKQLADRVWRLAQGLLRLGIEPGDVVAICAFNSDWYLVWLLAVTFIGAVLAPLNYRWSSKEAKWALTTVRPVMLITDDSCVSWNDEIALPFLKWRVLLEPSRSHTGLTTEALIETAQQPNQKNAYSFSPDSSAIICFTSGTTGKAKGVVLSHSSLIIQSLAKVAIVGYCENDVYLHTTPLCHVGGLSSALALLMVGGRHILIPRFEPNAAVDAIKCHSVSSLITVPTIMADIVRGSDPACHVSVTRILNGGGSLSGELLSLAARCFPKATILSAYGMTEACSSITFTTLHNPSIHVTSPRATEPNHTRGVCVGTPAPHVELTISADGRILTRGPHLMLRYYSDSAPHQSWLDTGDIGSIDPAGNLWLVGRANGRIKTGGENVYPEEIETVLLDHPGLTAAVVVGVPHPRLSEMVVACVKIGEGWEWSDRESRTGSDREQFLSDEVLRFYCREKELSRFKIPGIFFLWDKPFPVTSSGKVKRDQVRDDVVFISQTPRSFL